MIQKIVMILDRTRIMGNTNHDHIELESQEMKPNDYEIDRSWRRPIWEIDYTMPNRPDHIYVLIMVIYSPLICWSKCDPLCHFLSFLAFKTITWVGLQKLYGPILIGHTTM